MFAFFGLGLQEILILGLVGALIVVPIAVLVMTRSVIGSTSRVAELEAENRRLRAELDEKDRR